MYINILRYSLFGIAESQELEHTFVKFVIYPLAMIAYRLFIYRKISFRLFL